MVFPNESDRYRTIKKSKYISKIYTYIMALSTSDTIQKRNWNFLKNFPCLKAGELSVWPESRSTPFRPLSRKHSWTDTSMVLFLPFILMRLASEIILYGE